MPKIEGKMMTRRELLARVGRIDQIGGLRRVKLSEGPGAGVELVEFRTGTGFNFVVALSRGMDIPEAEYAGRSLCWQSSNSLAHPAMYDPRGFEWVRVFFGGLLTTCGLTYLGNPCVDGEEELGLHGRYTSLAAEEVALGTRWEGDDYLMWVEGTMRETRVVHEKVAMRRRISARLGEPRVCIEDVVENQGFTRTEHMILYHCNFGYPLLSETARVFAPSLKARPRTAAVPAEGWDAFLPPTPGFAEHVYYHEMRPDTDGWVTAGIKNAPAGLGAYIKYEAANLPVFIEWKMAGEMEYVLGLEPGNCGLDGRAAAREEGTLQFLEPGESRRYRLEIGMITEMR